MCTYINTTEAESSETHREAGKDKRNRMSGLSAPHSIQCQMEREARRPCAIEDRQRLERNMELTGQ